MLANFVGWGDLPQALARWDGSGAKGWEKEVAELRDPLMPEEPKAVGAATRNNEYRLQAIVGCWRAIS